VLGKMGDSSSLFSSWLMNPGTIFVVSSLYSIKQNRFPLFQYIRFILIDRAIQEEENVAWDRES
jgi:hypothetical protein